MLSLLHNELGLVRRFSFALVLVMCTAEGRAQAPEQEYHISKEYFNEYRPMIEADSLIFYRLDTPSVDAFGEATNYDMSFVAFARRGVGYREDSFMLDGVPLQSGSRSVLWRLGLLFERNVGVMRSPQAVNVTDCSRGTITAFTTDFAEPYGARSVGLNFATRGYNGGVRAAVNETLGRGWSLAATLSGRTGRDLHIEGVYTNGIDAGFSLAKRWRGRHKVALTALLSPSERGLRSSSSQEAFRLTGNTYYNPSWGFQAGKMRNANVRRTMIPVVVASYEARVAEHTELKVALGAEVGRGGYSSLTWFDAQTPMPDNYRYMPSYYASTVVADEVHQAWLDCDPRYTQIDWDELFHINRMGGGRAVYAVEERVERVTDIDFRASGTTRLSDAVMLRYGVAYTFERSRNYKQMSDLLGSEYVVDIDYFLVDDQTFNNRLQNDLRNPNRRIVEGDRYGYDYALMRSCVGVNGGVGWRTDRAYLDFDLSIGNERIYRNGYYEKELFAGSNSFGRSRVVRFMPYVVRLSAGYAFSPKQSLALSAAVQSKAPSAENIFLQSHYNNRIIDSPNPATDFSAEVNYRLHTKVFDLDATLFAALSRGGVRVAHYYDDLAATYSDMVVSEISQLRTGVELVASARFARHWSTSLAVTAGYYGYAKDARVSLYADSDNSVICNLAQARMGGVRLGNAPQVALSAEMLYLNRGWVVRLTATYAGLRYVEAEPMRRTDRVTHQGSVSEEIFSRFTQQERLPDAVSVDAALSKSFALRRGADRGDSRLVVSLTVRNLLGSKNMLYAGRESLRIRRSTIAGEYLYEPFPTRYTYAYPRTYYLALTYKF